MTTSLGLGNGFAWWLPIATTVVAALIAVAVSQTATAAWDADVHLWARDGRSASEYADLLLDRSVQDAAMSGMMGSADGSLVIDDVAVELNDTLIRLTVRSARQSDAETLAISLARAAVSESIIRYGGEAGLDVLGLVRPGARKVAPATEWTAAWASAVGLFAGLVLAWRWSGTSEHPSTALGRLGRIGLRPIAVIPTETERAADDAEMLAEVIDSRPGVIVLAPLDDDSCVSATLIQTARALAARGKSVSWLDARRPAFELDHGAPPVWLAGARWSPVARSELILRNAVHAARPNGHVLLLTDPVSDPSTVEVASAAGGALLMARADASAEQLSRARLLLGAAPLIGVVLTRAAASDLEDFELARMTD